MESEDLPVDPCIEHWGIDFPKQAVQEIRSQAPALPLVEQPGPASSSFAKSSHRACIILSFSSRDICCKSLVVMAQPYARQRIVQSRSGERQR